MTIKDTDGDIDVYTLPSSIIVAVDIAPDATFTANWTSIVAGQKVLFTHTGSNGNTPTIYQWNFGDLTANATVENPEHQYTTAGTYTVILTIIDVDLDIDVNKMLNYITVAVDMIPDASFSANVTSIIAGQKVLFTHVGSNGNAPTTYEWNFGDLTANATIENPEHQFISVGTYTVILTIKDTDGDIDVVKHLNYITVAIDLMPSAVFTANVTSIIAGQFVGFTHTGSNGNTPSSYQWNFGDLTVNATAENPKHKYLSAGTFTVKMTIQDVDGDIDVYTLP